MTFDTVTLDLDGTLLPNSTAFGEVLRRFGKEAEVVASDARFFAGETTLAECFHEQWEWFRSLSPADIHRALRQAAWLPDIREGVALLREAGLTVRMLSDQPDTVTDYGGRWGLAPAISSPVTVKEGVQEAIDFREDKLANLRAAGLDVGRVCHVGNGSNDVPIWQAGAYGIAVFAAPAVAAHAELDLGRPTSLLTVAERIVEIHLGGK